MIPGQLGPTNRVLLWVLRMLVTRIMSCWGIPSHIRINPIHQERMQHMPSVMQTTSGISAAMASSIPAAANGGGTKIAVASAPVSLTASLTFLKTGRERWVDPAFLGFVLRIVSLLNHGGGFLSPTLRQLSFHTRLLVVRGTLRPLRGCFVVEIRGYTHVPCFPAYLSQLLAGWVWVSDSLPVNPWKMTFVSELILKFGIVWL